MKRFRALLILTLVGAATFSVGQTISSIRTKAEAAIRSADQSGLKAAQAKDVDGATANYSSDASWLPPNSEIVQGKDAIRAAWAKMLATPGLTINWQITKLVVSPSGDMAYTLYSYVMTMAGPNGTPVQDRGKDMAVWEKKSNGTWQMVADTFNSDLPIPSTITK